MRHDSSAMDLELFGEESPFYTLFNSSDSLPSIQEEKEDSNEETYPSGDLTVEQQESPSSQDDSSQI
jgi:hypothetical protein